MVAFFSTLAGCDIYPPVKPQDQLNSPPPAAALKEGPSCASCHRYPLNDVHHAYHMSSINVNRDQFGDRHLNGMVTCMDCHYTSMQHFKFTGADTIWADSNGNEVVGHPHANDIVYWDTTYAMYRPLPYSPVDTSRGKALADELDTLMVREFAFSHLIEWMTGNTHNDGKVDVNFPPNNIVLPESLTTAFRPKDLSCSLVACHIVNDRYRWMDQKKGIGQCPSLLGENPECYEPNDPR